MLLGGPGSLGVVAAESDIESIAELGVSLLLFGLGLEFSVSRLRSLGKRALAGGALQVITTMTLAALAAFAFGRPLTEATAIGAMVCLSSTAVVLRLLMERSEVDAAHGRNAIAVLLVQDMAVVPLALLIGILSGEGSIGEVAANVGRIVGLAAALIVGLWLVLDKFAVRVLGTLTIERNRELAILLAVVTGLGSAVAAHAVGISPALGAFVAGMFLGASPFATQIRADVSSLRVVLLTLFFGAAGMVADPGWILRHLHLVLGVLALLTIGKAAIVWAIFRTAGLPSTVAAATGIALAQIGEFAFVLGEIAWDGRIIAAETRSLLVSVAIVSLFVSPYLVPRSVRLGAWLAARLSRSPVSPSADEVLSRVPPDIVVIGFGPAGRIATRGLVERSCRLLVIDLNPESVASARELGFDAEIGDATRVEVLEHAPIAGARAVAITIPHHEAALEILWHVRRLAPAAHSMVRSRYERHTAALRAAGAHAVFGDEEEIGAALGEHLAATLPPTEPPPSPGERSV